MSAVAKGGLTPQEAKKIARISRNRSSRSRLKRSLALIALPVSAIPGDLKRVNTERKSRKNAMRKLLPTWKLFLPVLFLSCFFLFGAVAEESGTCGTNLTWTLDGGTLTISGTGGMNNYWADGSKYRLSGYDSSMASPWAKETVTRVVIENGVTGIGANAFATNAALTSVSIPDSVVTISGGAFFECRGLSEIQLPPGLNTIGDYAFSGCAGLETAVIPDSVTSFGTNVFEYCTGLREATVPGSISMLNTTFLSCSSLENVQLAEGIKRLNRTFSGSGIKTVVLPDTITHIDYNAFFQCASLEEITIPSSVTTLGTNAFNSCKALKTITVPASVTIMADAVFSGCTAMEEIYFEGKVPSIPPSGTSSRRHVFNNMPGRVWCHCDPKNDTWNAICSGTNTQFGDNVRYGRYGECTGGFTWRLVDGVLTVEGSGVLTDATWHSKLDVQEIILPETLSGIAIRVSDYGAPETITLPGQIAELSSDALDGIGTVICAMNSLTAKTLGKMGMSFRCAEYPGIEFLWTEKDGAWELQLAGVWDGNLTDAVIPEGVTVIPERFFSNLPYLERVTLPSSLREIGGSAFAQCTELTGLTLPAGLERIGDFAFSGCYGLHSIFLPDGLKFIGSGVFQYNEGVTVYGFPSSLTEIGREAFSNITLEGNVLITGDMAFGERPFANSQLGNVTVAEGVTALPDGLFSGASFGKLTLPASLRSIGNSAFSFSVSEEKHRLDLSGVSSLGEAAFQGCSWLTEITLSKDTDTLPDSVFRQCDSLEKAVLPDGISVMEALAFSECTSLKNISLPATLRDIGTFAFYGCTVLAEVSLPDGLESIEAGVFQDCASLAVIELPSSVAVVYENAFSGCSGLQKVTLPEGLTGIWAGAFENCAALREISLPEKLDRIGYRAFAGCEAIERLELTDTLMEIADESLPPNACHLVTYGSYCAERAEALKVRYSYRPYTPDSVSASVPASILYGGFGQITLTLSPDDLRTELYDEPEFIFESDNEQILTVTESGVMKGRGPGTAFVTVRDRLNRAVSDTVQVTVIDKTGPKLGAFVKVSYSGGAAASITYGAKSGVPPYSITLTSGGDVIKSMSGVDQNQSGMASFSASAGRPSGSDGFARTVIVSVQDAAGNSAVAHGSFSLDVKTKQVGVGTPTVRMVRDEYGNVGYQYTYSSYREEITKTPHSSSEDTLSGVMTSLSAARELLLAVGERESLSVSASGSSVVFTTDDWHIADPNYDGTVTAVAPGGTTVYTRAVDGSGLVAATRVTVVEKRILAESLELFLNPECDQQLSWRFQPEDVTDPNVRFTVEDNSVLKVNDGGYLRFLKEGSTTVRAVAQDGSGVFAELEVSGSPAHSHIPLTQTKAQLSRNGQNGYSPRMTCAVCQAALCEDEIIRPDECITLPQALKTVEAEAFFGNRTAKQVYIPDGAERIGSAAFASSKLLLVRIPDSVTELAADAFDGCENLCIICSAGSAAAHFAQACRIAWVPEE